jgi:hypothetical protein
LVLEAPEVIVDDNHVYSEGGKACPRSVTGLLKRYGLSADISHIPPRIIERARQRGNAVDVGFRLIAQGVELDPATIDPAIAPYLDAFRKFWKESGAVLIESGVPRISPLGFGFTPDLILFINGRRTVVDGKATCKIPKSVGPQTAGYKIGWNSLYTTERIEDRAALWLKPDSSYKLVTLEDADDERAFMDCLEADIKLEQWRSKYHE